MLPKLLASGSGVEMTNFEKYKNEIMKIVTENRGNFLIAMKDGMLFTCTKIDCTECDFNITGEDGYCGKNRFKWLYEDDDCCRGCKYEYKRKDESPCVKCYHNYTSKFECRLTKIRQDELLKLYPNIRKVNGVIDICPGDLDMYHQCRSEGPSGEGCVECIREYWLQEVEK